jgi:hypothetical protein
MAGRESEGGMTDTGVTTEVWSPIGHGFSAYQASSHGRVRSVDRTLAGGRRCKGVVLKTRVSNRGYLLVNVRDDYGTVQTRTVHTLVMLAFVGLPPRGQQTRHLDDDPANNRWAPGGENVSRAAGGNLIYGTAEENAADKIRNAASPLAWPAPPPTRTRRWSRSVRVTVRHWLGRGDRP